MQITKPDVTPWVALAGTLISLIAQALGETTEETIRRVQADCKARAADPSDETDAVTVEIDADLPPPMPGSDR